MDVKTCFKCNQTKPLDEFYKHIRMRDGHLNKCKECTKLESKSNYKVKSEDPLWLEKERIRGREKFKRLNYKNKHRLSDLLKKERSNLSRILRGKGFLIPGKEAHHWNYNLPHSIMLMSKSAHRRVHKYISVNYEDKMCYKSNGEPILNENDAIKYTKDCLLLEGVTEDIRIINLNQLLI